MADGGNGPSDAELGLTQKDLGIDTSVDKSKMPNGALKQKSIYINGIDYDPLHPHLGSEYQQNIKILETESTSLLKAYEIAVEYDPRLSYVKIIPEKNENHPFFAKKPWKTESGKGEVHILFGDSGNIGQIAVLSITENPDFEQQFRSWVYARPDQEISPQLARVYVFLHELGHIVDSYDHLNDPEAYDTKMQILKNNLPLGYLSVSGIKQRYNSGDVEFRQKVESNYGTLENATAKYRKIRHELSFEKKADEFAHKILQRNATTLVALANNLYKS